jgi:hypothetical protein
MKAVEQVQIGLALLFCPKLGQSYSREWEKVASSQLFFRQEYFFVLGLAIAHE